MLCLLFTPYSCPNDAMDTVAEFQKRRAAMWRHTRISIAIILIGIIVSFFHCKGVQPEPGLRFWICLLSFLAVAAAIVHVTFAWKRLYRCPSCEVPVMNSLKRGGMVPFNPKDCPNCGVRLWSK